jgi:FeS assembly SUF system regulator
LVWFHGVALIRLSRLTDYGIVVMSHMAAHGDSIVTARELADRSTLPLPTVSKVLKLLSKAQLIESHRGVNGGYQLARSPEQICVTDMIDALEGPVALTNCADESDHCQFDQHCPVKSPWQKINRVVRDALAQLTLNDLRRLS